MEYFIPLCKNGQVEFSKLGRVSAYCFFKWNDRSLEFYQFLANWSFLLKKGKNLVKNVGEGAGTESPCELVAGVGIFAPIDEVDLSTKSLKKPFEGWSFSVIALKQNLIDKIVAIFGMMSVNTKAAFRVNKSCEISKVFNRGFNGISSGFKSMFEFGKYQVKDVLLSGDFIYTVILAIPVDGVAKGKKNGGLFFLFDKVWIYLRNKSRLIPLKAKMINRFVTLAGVFGKNITTETLLEPFHRLLDGGNNQKVGHKFLTCFDLLPSKIKAAISVNIPSSVSEIGFLNHTTNCS